MPIKRSTFKWELMQKDNVYTIIEYRLDGSYGWTKTSKMISFKNMTEACDWITQRELGYIDSVIKIHNGQ